LIIYTHEFTNSVRQPLIDADVLRTLLVYNPETGVFSNKITRSSNSKEGSEAGSLQNNGYVSIHIHGRKYLAHRLAYLYMTGRWPEGFIDHINGIRTDNSWLNLRECNNSQNMHNLHREYKNVYPNGSGYMVKISKDNQEFYLGTFKTKQEAKDVAIKARKLYHGSFAYIGKEAINASTH
jgi:hypothetical protein